MQDAAHFTPFALSHEELRNRAVDDVRAAIRAGDYVGHTAGLAQGMLQANLVILPVDLAHDFQAFCVKNPRPCPLVGVSKPGSPRMPHLGGSIDLRTDVPMYNVYRHAELYEQVEDISSYWDDDSVAFAIGCSFTFERALQKAGIRQRHIERDRCVSMYRTSIELTRVGPFGGGMVVSMRPIPEADVARVKAICAQYPHAHGAPIHIGDPAVIGIHDLDAPDWGEPASFEPGEVPVFWACGVTPQNALAAARPRLCITHKPGSMLLTDVREDERPVVDLLMRP
ncbi:MAG: putative hydro-lyase [Pseudomonadota bacterium]